MIVGEIRSLHHRVERTVDALRHKVDDASKSVVDSNRFAVSDYWQLRILYDGMIRVRLIIEQNLEFIETLSLLATSRYFLELLIWFRLLETGNPDYCFTYVKKLVTDQCDHARERLSKAKSEIAIFKELEAREAAQTGEAAHKSLKSFSKSYNMIAGEVDRVARRKFCLYNSDANTRGYGYQAALLEKQLVPQLEKEVEELEKREAEAISQMPKSPREDKHWSWKQQAAAAGMAEQFEFLYAYTSRLLHATPMSLTTHEKSLVLGEITMFLDFIYISILDVIEIAEKHAGISNPLVH
jgi:hypothetical protein